MPRAADRRTTCLLSKASGSERRFAGLPANCDRPATSCHLRARESPESFHEEQLRSRGGSNRQVNRSTGALVVFSVEPIVAHQRDERIGGLDLFLEDFREVLAGFDVLAIPKNAFAAEQLNEPRVQPESMNGVCATVAQEDIHTGSFLHDGHFAVNRAAAL